MCKKHNALTDELYLSIFESCISSAEQCIPQSKTSTSNRDRKNIPGRSEQVEPYRQRAIFWHDMWISQG